MGDAYTQHFIEHSVLVTSTSSILLHIHLFFFICVVFGLLCVSLQPPCLCMGIFECVFETGWQNCSMLYSNQTQFLLNDIWGVGRGKIYLDYRFHVQCSGCCVCQIRGERESFCSLLCVSPPPQKTFFISRTTPESAGFGIGIKRYIEIDYFM